MVVHEAQQSIRSEDYKNSKDIYYVSWLEELHQEL